MKKIVFILTLFSSLFVQADVLKLKDFPNVYESDHFRLYFNNTIPSGTQYLPSSPTNYRIDTTPKDGYPDNVVKIALKLENAYRRFTQEFGWKDPAISNRYSGKVDPRMGVAIMNLSPGAGGEASPNLSTDPKQRPILLIKLSYNNSLTNASPEHELFHLFQHGYSLLNNGWFKEGSARWVQGMVETVANKRIPLPANANDFKFLTEVMNVYDASSFWNRLTYLCDATSPENNPGYPEKPLYGTVLMKSLLENLELESNSASADRCFKSPIEWTYDQQSNNLDNHMYIFKAIKQTIYARCPSQQIKSAEVSNFLNEVNRHIAAFYSSRANFDLSTQRVYLPSTKLASNTSSLYFKTILEMMPDTNPLRFTLINQTPVCTPANLPTASYNIAQNLLTIPMLDIPGSGTYFVDFMGANSFANGSAFDLRILNKLP